MSVAETITLDDLLDPDLLRADYQPIVDLDSGETVAYEALARWPGGAIGPERALALATAGGWLAELDWACQAAALRGALDARLGRQQTLFINVEPSTLGLPTPEALTSLVAEAGRDLRVVVELTERALLTRPAELLRAVAAMRERGWGIALDDVGAVPDSLALLPFIEPDVIKLDLQLVQRWPDVTQAEIMAAVMAHSERTGTTLLAEGIETDAHVEQALALGATLGQGWLYAKAGPLADLCPGRRRVPFVEPPTAPAGTPFDLVDRSPQVRVGRKGMLLAISRHIEDQGLAHGIPPVVLAAFQSARHFTPYTQRRFTRLGRVCPLVVALGAGLPTDLGPGLRGASLTDDDRLQGEWTVVVVGAHYAGALIARDLGDGGPDQDRRYAFRVTHDRRLVLAAARSLLTRVQATTTSGA
jgi:EAL domain-containing protein (putative c-di-GMP-specific phosphodiesterase class I)